MTFLARQGEPTGGTREQVPVTLSVNDFVQRWCLHIQPEQLTKTRYLGGWSNNRREAYLARCEEQLTASGQRFIQSNAPKGSQFVFFNPSPDYFVAVTVNSGETLRRPQPAIKSLRMVRACIEQVSIAVQFDI